jgi:20S proteasome subunit beta 4
MDRYYEKNMSLERALALVDRCIEEVRSRLVVSPPNFVIKIVDKDGAREYAWRRTVEDKQGPPSAAAAAAPVASPMAEDTSVQS